MTTDDIMKLAREAGFLVDGDSWIHAGAVLVDGRKSIDEQLKNFANLVAAAKAEVALAEAYRCGVLAGAEAEREACAKECEHTSLRMGSEWMAAHCAAAIRARGNT
jgi:ribosomal protein L12E/L44/L45/RPP1/RPP2